MCEPDDFARWTEEEKDAYYDYLEHEACLDQQREEHGQEHFDGA